jgi:aspartate kinase
MKLYIIKVGGASVFDASSIKMLLQHVRNNMQRPTIVFISALGKVTNMLEVLVHSLDSNMYPVAVKSLSELYKFHRGIIKNLFPPSREKKILKRLDEILSIEDIDSLIGESFHDLVYSEIIPKGEILSSYIVSSYLNYMGSKNKLVFAPTFIKTDDNFVNANVLLPETEKAAQSIFTEDFIQQNPLIITQGFIGRMVRGIRTTLPREGSDLSAVVAAISLGAESLDFWKKRGIPGNPSKLSYQEFQEVEENSTRGRLLFPQALQLLIENKITFGIINFDNPKERTVIG